MIKIYVRHSPMGQYMWQMIARGSNEILATSKEYDTRDAVYDDLNLIASNFGIMDISENVIDQTPEGKRGDKKG